jgi:hypothetical protein
MDLDAFRASVGRSLARRMDRLEFSSSVRAGLDRQSERQAFNARASAARGQ